MVPVQRWLVVVVVVTACGRALEQQVTSTPDGGTVDGGAGVGVDVVDAGSPAPATFDCSDALACTTFEPPPVDAFEYERNGDATYEFAAGPSTSPPNALLVKIDTVPGTVRLIQRVVGDKPPNYELTFAFYPEVVTTPVSFLLIEPAEKHPTYLGLLMRPSADQTSVRIESQRITGTPPTIDVNLESHGTIPLLQWTQFRIHSEGKDDAGMSDVFITIGAGGKERVGGVLPAAGTLPFAISFGLDRFLLDADGGGLSIARFDDVRLRSR